MRKCLRKLCAFVMPCFLVLQGAVFIPVPMARAAGINLFLGATVESANGQTNQYESGNQTVDGDMSSKWCRQNTTAASPGIIVLRLSDVCDINHLEIYHSSTNQGNGYDANPLLNTREFTVEYSIDGTNWTQLAHVTDNTASMSGFDMQTPARMQYLRLTVITPSWLTDSTNPTLSGDVAALRIVEIEGFGTRETNVLQGAAVVSSTGSTNQYETAEHMLDGNMQTKWCQQNISPSSPGVSVIKLDGVYSLNCIDVFHCTSNPNPGGYDSNTLLNTKEFRLEYSLDANNWTQFAYQNNNSALVSIFSLATPITAQFIRITVLMPSNLTDSTDPTLSSDVAALRIIELKGYGVKDDPSFTTTLGDSNTLNATVQNPVTGNTYQMWVYQKLPADVTGQETDQYIWVPMTAGANNSFSLAGATADESGNYLVSMIETDASGNVVSKSFDTPASKPTNAVRIEKILVGGKVTNGRETVNLDDSAQASQNIQIVADNATGYTLTYGTTDNQTSVSPDATGNTFPVSFSALGVGTYTFTATATNNAGQKDTRALTFTVYSTTGSGAATPVISGLSGGFVGNSLGLTLTGADTQGNSLKDGDGFLYRFRAGEPGRGLNYTAYSVNGPTGSVPVLAGKYGTYQVYATAAYGTKVSYDDAAMGYFDYTRPGGPVTVSSYTVKKNGGADSSATDQTGTTGKTYSFNATADVSKLTGGETERYSFWRCDASGWVLLKDWSPDATLSWTPAYAGKYIIQVRVQGSKAGSYESARNMTFDVSSATGLATAKNVSLTLAVTGNKARQPVTLTTAATPSAGLLYRYQVQDPTLGLTVLRAYSPDNTFTWVPRKTGKYTVYVQVINQNSFGMYDTETSQPATIG